MVFQTTKASYLLAFVDMKINVSVMLFTFSEVTYTSAATCSGSGVTACW